MNDRLKLRIYDKERKSYKGDYMLIEAYDKLTITRIAFDKVSHEPVFITDENKYIAEQCTGLKDKTDRLIFEGDKLEWQEQTWECPETGNIEDKTYCGEVKFMTGAFWFCWKSDNAFHRVIMRDVNPYELEVIGNIHEEEKGVEK